MLRVGNARRATGDIRFGQGPHRFIPLADQHHAEGLVAFQTALDHQTITRFEDMQVQRHARKEHRVEWKEGQFVHLPSIVAIFSLKSRFVYKAGAAYIEDKNSL